MDTTEYTRDGYVIRTDKRKLDLNVVHAYLSQRSYWAQGRSMKTVIKSIKNSLCFGLYDQQDNLVGFARVVTDYATFVWLCDVFILESHQGQNLGKWLIEVVTNHPDLKNLRNFLLATRDAHELYRRYGGFEKLENADRWMMRPRK
ncbi:MAG: GNAT family N-acetyltransferase [Anaerolineae bacterium]|nr:GNAT family N-acetyltransferase [Anaerolineae bacterium]